MLTLAFRSKTAAPAHRAASMAVYSYHDSYYPRKDNSFLYFFVLPENDISLESVKGLLWMLTEC